MYYKFQRRLGRRGDGGKWVCDPHRISRQSSCLVYSFGSSEEYSFEQDVVNKLKCEVHTFDPFWNETTGFPKKFNSAYHKIGLSADDRYLDDKK